MVPEKHAIFERAFCPVLAGRSALISCRCCKTTSAFLITQRCQCLYQVIRFVFAAVFVQGYQILGQAWPKKTRIHQ